MLIYKHIFGPVPSRRLGVSLGIDLVPFKICSMNCVYCEIGKTRKLTIKRDEYVNYDEVINEIDSYLSNNSNLDFITFSGAGEPTLNNRIGDIIHHLKTNYSQYKIALLTNGTLFTNQQVIDECLDVDLILPSLDAVSNEVFQKINRPHPDLNNLRIIESLIQLRNNYRNKLWIEVFIVPGLNDNAGELLLLKQKLEEINPDLVQLNTLDRPGTEKWVTPISNEKMQKIANQFYPLKTEIIAKYKPREEIKSYKKQNEETIISLLARRPCTEIDLIELTGLKINEINKYLSSLISNGKIEEEYNVRGLFYKLNRNEENIYIVDK
ncbi:MAG: radical SAM protein [Melioribacteraceae bacterium]|nr:radical SAM protein [Melioribacteraceae bacterium]